MDTVTKQELVEMLTKMLLVRAGEVVDEKLAMERARNIAAALSGLMIVEK